MRKILGIIGVLAVLAGMWGCRAKERVVEVAVHDSVAVRTVHVERIDTVWGYLPTQTVERIVKGDSSHLETQYAESWAWVLEDGTLHHRLENKTEEALKVPYVLPGDTVYKEVMREKPVKVREEVERDLNWWEKWMITSGLVAWGAVIALGVWKIRKVTGKRK